MSSGKGIVIMLSYIHEAPLANQQEETNDCFDGRRFAADWGLVGQTVLLFAVWIYLCSLHWNNDGLWFQGDAPRHALTGLFWKDYLQSFPTNLKDYTLSYFARYPAIKPTSYPPLFHWLEGGMYGLAGPSPYVAKHLVLLFALLSAVYTMLWLRRWLAPEAGWAGALLLLLPGIVRWSHGIMLNVPALGFSLAALFYMRCWMDPQRDTAGSRQLYLGVALSVAAVATYYPGAVVLVVIGAWLACFGGYRRLLSRRTLAWAGASSLAVAPLGWLLLRWAPTSVGWVIPAGEQVASLGNWLYYAVRLPNLVGFPLLGLAAAGAAAGCASRRWRHETWVLLIWIAVVYLVFSLIRGKESRYVLLLCPALLMLGTIAILVLVQAVGRRLRATPAAIRIATAAMVLLLIGVQVEQAWRIPVPALSGFREAAAFFRRHAPAEPVLYDGYYDGPFTFYVRAGDPGFRQQVVLGNKLLYAYALDQGWHLEEYASTPDQVLEILQSRGGCRWLAIEMSDRSDTLAAARLLREVVQREEFQQVASFSMGPPGRIDIYQLLVPVQTPEFVELPFPILGAGTRFRTRPIPARRLAHDRGSQDFLQ